MRSIRVGTRGSELALVQARAILNALDGEGELIVIQTRGDRVVDRPLNRVGGAGLFIKEIESALLDSRIDLAVHSMKDVPSEIAEGLTLAATTKRIDPRDVLVSRRADSLAAIPPGARLATGSLRRRSQLLAARPDLRVEDLRGNVPTRLQKFDASNWEAIVLAGAGLVRLGLAGRIRAFLPIEEMLPAVGQGALALEARADDGELRERLDALNDPDSSRAVASERAFLGRLEGGCQVPIGAYAEVSGNQLRLRGFVGSVDGTRTLKRAAAGRANAPYELGLALAEEMLSEGAADIVREVVPDP